MKQPKRDKMTTKTYSHKRNENNSKESQNDHQKFQSCEFASETFAKSDRIRPETAAADGQRTEQFKAQ